METTKNLSKNYFPKKLWALIILQITFFQVFKAEMFFAT